MNATLTTLILGTGFAGEGHVAALQAAGTEVIGLVGRTPSVVQEGAAKQGIPFAGPDWQKALTTCEPDIVSIATPGGAHYAPIKQAIDFGAHVFCDMPMTHSRETAQELYALARARGIKTACAPQHSARKGTGGRRRNRGAATEVECMSHFNLERQIPIGWSHRKPEGGGRLNNNFTHTLSIVASVLGEKLLSICGDVRDDLGRAPMVEGVHNFATRRNHIPKDLTDPALQWGESDVEWSYTVMARVQSPFAKTPVSVVFNLGGGAALSRRSYRVLWRQGPDLHLGSLRQRAALPLDFGNGGVSVQCFLTFASDRMVADLITAFF